MVLVLFHRPLLCAFPVLLLQPIGDRDAERALPLQDHTAASQQIGVKTLALDIFLQCLSPSPFVLQPEEGVTAQENGFSIFL